MLIAVFRTEMVILHKYVIIIIIIIIITYYYYYLWASRTSGFASDYHVTSFVMQ